MLFRITGVDARGRKREVSIVASSEADALQKASEVGITAPAAVALPPLAPVAAWSTGRSGYARGFLVGCLAGLLFAVGAIALLVLVVGGGGWGKE